MLDLDKQLIDVGDCLVKAGILLEKIGKRGKRVANITHLIAEKVTMPIGATLPGGNCAEAAEIQKLRVRCDVVACRASGPEAMRATCGNLLGKAEVERRQVNA